VPSPSVEDYIKAIYKAHADNGSVATQELAERLHVSAPAVSKMMRKLSVLKLITHAPYQGVKLTRAGEKLALEIIRHHRLIELYLVQAMGFSWDSVHEEAERLNRLVGNLLDMTRVASGALRPKKEWHPLDEIVGVALNRLEERLSGREVAVRLPADLPPLPIDAVLIEQVLINLLENALKYTPLGSPIAISAVSEGGGVQIDVADRGPGVLERERSLIFDKFYRSKPDVSDGGAGLGLAICRGVVEAHGGRIWVDANEGGGANFRFWLPLDGVPPLPGEAWQQTA